MNEIYFFPSLTRYFYCFYKVPEINRVFPETAQANEKGTFLGQHPICLLLIYNKL